MHTDVCSIQFPPFSSECLTNNRTDQCSQVTHSFPESVNDEVIEYIQQSVIDGKLCEMYSKSKLKHKRVEIKTKECGGGGDAGGGDDTWKIVLGVVVGTAVLAVPVMAANSAAQAAVTKAAADTVVSSGAKVATDTPVGVEQAIARGTTNDTGRTAGFSKSCLAVGESWLSFGDKILGTAGAVYVGWLVLIGRNKRIYIENATTKHIHVMVYEKESTTEEIDVGGGNGNEDDEEEDVGDDDDDKASPKDNSTDKSSASMVSLIGNFKYHMKYEQNTTIVHGAIPQSMTVLRGNYGNFLVSNDTYLTVMTYTESYDHTKYCGASLEESGTQGFVIHLMDGSYVGNELHRRPRSH